MELMMGDRELLEAAAKAAGMTPRWMQGLAYDEQMKEWDPISSDGDALRLAVKLELCQRVDHKSGFSWVKKHDGSVPHDGDPYAATRRAIVRAAAEIGGAIND